MVPTDPLNNEGWVIALEGLDGCGTTTQADLLSSRLESEGFQSLVTREPSKGPVGELIRLALSTTTPGDHPTFPAYLALLFAADRLEHLERRVRPAVERGEIVVTDRSVLSSLVYQSLELPESWVQAINDYAPLPHLIIWIDTTVQVCLERIHGRQGTLERFEKRELQEQLHPRYKVLCDHGFPRVECIRVNGNQDVQAVHEEIWGLLQETRSFQAKPPGDSGSEI